MAAVRLKGLARFQRDMKRLGDVELKKEIDDQLRAAAQLVADDARRRLQPINAYSAAGLRPRVRGFGRVVVEQSRRRTTGLRPDWGEKIMKRDLIPAVRQYEEEIVRRMDRMLAKLGGEYF